MGAGPSPTTLMMGPQGADFSHHSEKEGQLGTVSIASGRFLPSINDHWGTNTSANEGGI